MFSRRESKRRAVLKLLDRIPIRPTQPRLKRKRGQSNFSDPAQTRLVVPEKLT